MSISSNFRSLPRNTKTSLVLGIVLALTVALPLFVWTALYVNFNVKEKAADDGSNYCGGTCGSNFNCQPNLYCYKGFCRNPICSDDTDCTCAIATPTAAASLQPKATIKPTATASATVTPTITPEPKGGNENYGNLIISTPEPPTSSEPVVEEQNPIVPENQFAAKYALYIFGAFVIIAILSIVLVVKRNKPQDIPHILPPTSV